MADSEPKRLLKPPEQYSPLSKLKFACMTGDVEAVNKLLASGTDPLATEARAALKQEKVRRWINAHSNSYVPKKRRRS